MPSVILSPSWKPKVFLLSACSSGVTRRALRPQRNLLAWLPESWAPRPAPPLASFDGFRSRTLIFLLSFFSAILLFFLRWVVCCLCCVVDTEQQLMPVRHVLFWNQVIQTNQFIFPALGPLIPDSPAGAFFLFFGTLTSAFYIISILAKFGNTGRNKSARCICS